MAVQGTVRRRRGAVLACLLVPALTSGCLGNDVFPEPYAWFSGPEIAGRGDAVREFQVPDAATRVRVWVGADFRDDAPLLGSQAGLEARIRTPSGSVSAYRFTQSTETRDLFGGTVGGRWTASFSDPDGSTQYRLVYDVYAPKYVDWAWWQVWNR